MEVLVGAHITIGDGIDTGNPTSTRNTLLPVRTESAYRLRGYSLNWQSEEVTTVGPKGAHIIAMLKSSPVSLLLDDSTFFADPAISAMMSHKAVLGMLLATASKMEQGVEGAAMGVQSMAGPWVTFGREGYMVPGLYAETVTVQSVIGFAGNQRVGWQVHYDVVRMSSLKVAALAAGRGWDPDSDEDEFPTEQLGHRSVPRG